VVPRLVALNESDVEGLNKGMDLGQAAQAVDATQRSEEPVSTIILNVCALIGQKVRICTGRQK
jgi:hypothetical protein